MKLVPIPQALPEDVAHVNDKNVGAWSIQALRISVTTEAQNDATQDRFQAPTTVSEQPQSTKSERGVAGTDHIPAPPPCHLKKVLIVGAGWYGCHCAMVCQRLGIEFDMVDSANAIMAESSVRNQNRLHLGFHYPRCHATRTECVTGYVRFMAAYQDLTVQVPRNMYLVSKDSVIDFRTFVNIFKYEETPFAEIPMAKRAGLPFDWLPEHYEGALVTGERMIDCDKVAAFFRSQLGDHLLPGCSPGDIDMRSLSTEVAFKGQQYELAFDCTYGQLDRDAEHVFELCCSWVYKFKHPVAPADLFGFTVMDGPFFSFFPYKPTQNLFTLTHVRYTPLMESTDIAKLRGQMSSDEVVAKIKDNHRQALAHVLKSVPSFGEAFEYQDHFLSIKCKSGLKNDDRSLRISESANVVSFCGGKITGIFSMEDYLMRKFGPTTLLAAKVPVMSAAKTTLTNEPTASANKFDKARPEQARRPGP